MKINEQIEDALKDVKKGSYILSSEVKSLLGKKYGIGADSIIISDLCYNRTNLGVDFKKQPHLFEYLKKNSYTWLGSNHPYNREIRWKPKQGAERKVGEWKNGKILYLEELN